MTTHSQSNFKARALGLLVISFAGIPSAHGQITSPVPGTVLRSTTVTFTWNQFASASSYYLGVGTAPGSANIFSRNVGLATTQSVSGIPLGSLIYVTQTVIFGPPKPASLSANVNYSYNYVYATLGSAAVMIAPTPGKSINYLTSFAWSTGSGAAAYGLMVGTSPGGSDLWNSSTLATTETVDFRSAKQNLCGLPIYVRLYTLLGSLGNGVWAWNDYTYVYDPSCGI
jgi:hypothetical protein